MIQRLVIFIVFSIAVVSHAQQEVRIHSHNDYEQRVPFWDAFSAGAKSIEADVFFKDGELFVAHEREHIRMGRTLETLYLMPLKRAEKIYGGEHLGFQLMIDVKTEAYITLEAIVAALEV
ncbi:hypothetical protein [Flagellimonas myxillae]|uniref:hypothetical protein n=1 Tax=Flagellimonas myxillae TaxID=2942214 RepID=UPI00201EEFCB|nr:hypothetical protein [Muricauda myxillae]MCL6265001.1 hypothetical protein [Muricauda myxillae]